MSEYNLDYFINKFEAIPEDKWIGGQLTHPADPDCHCALGHCGVTESGRLPDNPLYDGGGWLFTLEAVALINIFGGHNIHEACKVYNVNDLNVNNDSSTPKSRILSYLKELKNNE